MAAPCGSRGGTPRRPGRAAGSRHLGVQPHFGSGDTDGARLLAGIIRTAAPLIERTGVATAAQIGAETLLQRLSEELQVAAAVFAHPILLGAWATSQAT